MVQNNFEAIEGQVISLKNRPRSNWNRCFANVRQKLNDVEFLVLYILDFQLLNAFNIIGTSNYKEGHSIMA